MVFFAHLAFSFAAHPENLAVEALGHILRRSPAANAALQRSMTRLGSSIQGQLTFRTQVASADGTRPDLAGFDTQGTEVVFVEAKFWAGMTDQQPVGYLRRLSNEQETTLLFLVPTARIETIWPKIVSRAIDAGLELTEVGESQGGSARAVRIHDRTVLAITDWNTVLLEMLAEADGRGEQGAASDIRQLAGLCQRMDHEGFHPLRGEDMGPDVPRRILQLNAMAGEVVQTLEARGDADLKGLRPAGRLEGYRQYARIKNTLVWLGVDFEYWGSVAETPLWLGTQQSAFAQFIELRSKFSDYEHAVPPRVYVDAESARFPIDLPLGAEKQEVLDAVIDQVLRVCSRFGNTEVEGHPS